MNKAGFHLIFALALATANLSAVARTWTNQQNRPLEAELIKVHENQTADFKIKGRTRTLPFSIFSDADQKLLNKKLSESRGEFPAYQQINDALGIPLFQDAFLWDDNPAQAAKRLKLPKETETSYMVSFRRYAYVPTTSSTTSESDEEMKDKIMLVAEQPAFSLALYGNPTHIDYVSVVFVKADQTRRAITEKLTRALGAPTPQCLGDQRARENVLVWKAGAHTLLMNNDGTKIFTLRILPAAQADWSGTKIKRSSAEKRAKNEQLKQRILRRENGDVVLTDLPMINQGPIGHCVPATWERYMRYMGIPGDMYVLAAAWNADDGGGTLMEPMKKGVGRILYLSGTSLSDQKTRISVPKIKYYIDKGQPVMWVLHSTPEFRQIATDATAKRNGIKKPAEWAAELKLRTKKLKQLIPNAPYGHMCLIIGYNESTGEIAISDSWGKKYAERWVLAKEAEIVSQRHLLLINL